MSLPMLWTAPKLGTRRSASTSPRAAGCGLRRAMGEFWPSRNWNTRVELVFHQMRLRVRDFDAAEGGPLMAVSIAVDKVQR
jgi:hypothetical protein